MHKKQEEIANKADMIVNGYAFTRQGESIHVLNLGNPDKASVMRMNGEVLETSMDDIEIHIVQDYLARNLRFLEV